MKWLIGLLCLVVLAQVCLSDVPDSPGNTGYGLNFPSGSLIIDMGLYQIEDTTVQGDLDPHPENTQGFRQNGSVAGLFNMYSYGFAIKLLSNKIPVNWVIRSGKEKDGVDVAAVQVTRIHPTRDPSSSLNADAWGPSYGAASTQISLSGGPLFIDAVNADAALTVLSGLQSSYSGSGRFESLVIFKVESPVTVPVRHRILNVPQILVSSLSGKYSDYSAIPNILANAGVSQGTKEQGGNYRVLDNNDDSYQEINEYSMSTLVVENNAVFESTNPPSYVNNLRAFLNSGGNFWVQSGSITSHENIHYDTQFSAPADASQQVGSFFSKYGVQGLGNIADSWAGQSFPSAWEHVNPDLPVTQFIGDLGWAPGSVHSWWLRDNPTGSSSQFEADLWANNAFPLIRNPNSAVTYNRMSSAQGQMGPCEACCDGAACPFNNTLPASRSAYTAVAARLTGRNGSPLGGYIWALGGDSWYSNQASGAWANGEAGPSGTNENANLYNGRRMFLNAAITPAQRNVSDQFCTLDSDCGEFGPCARCNDYIMQCFYINDNCASGQFYNTDTCMCQMNTPSPTSSASFTPSISESSSVTSSPTSTASISSTSSASNSASISSTSSASNSASISSTASASATSVASQSSTSSVSTSASISSTASASATSGASKSSTSSVSATASKSRSGSVSTSASKSISGSVSTSPSKSITSAASKSPSTSVSNSISRTSAPSSSRPASKSASSTVSKSAPISNSPAKSNSPSSAVSKTRAASKTPAPSNSPKCGKCKYFNIILGTCRDVFETRIGGLFHQFWDPSFEICIIIGIGKNAEANEIAAPEVAHEGTANIASIATVAAVAIIAVVFAVAAVVVFVAIKRSSSAAARAPTSV